MQSVVQEAIEWAGQSGQGSRLYAEQLLWYHQQWTVDIFVYNFSLIPFCISAALCSNHWSYGFSTLRYCRIDVVWVDPSEYKIGQIHYFFLPCTNHIDGLVQERHNSIALAMELCLSCTNPSICNIYVFLDHIIMRFNWNMDFEDVVCKSSADICIIYIYVILKCWKIRLDLG